MVKLLVEAERDDCDDDVIHCSWETTWVIPWSYSFRSIIWSWFESNWSNKSGTSAAAANVVGDTNNMILMMMNRSGNTDRRTTVVAVVVDVMHRRCGDVRRQAWCAVCSVRNDDGVCRTISQRMVPTRIWNVSVTRIKWIFYNSYIQSSDHYHTQTTILSL